MTTQQQSRQHKVPTSRILITFLVIILFSSSQKAFAQQWKTSDSGNDIFNLNTGNVGVGTTSPGVKLDILSSVNLIARFGSTAGAHSQVLIDAPAGFNSNLTLQRGGVSKWYMGNRASNDRLSFIDSTGAVETLTLLQNGKVGIGTSNPLYSLDVNGGINGFRTKAATTSGNDVISTFENANGIQAIVRGNGNVGIGTASPDARLTIVGAGTTLPTTYNPGNVATFVAPTDWFTNIALVKGGITNPQGLHFGVNQASLFSEIQAAQNGVITNTLVLNRQGGNVGIGTAAPAFKLDVAGQIRSSSGGFVFPDGTVQTTAGGGSSQWTTSSTSIFYNGGNVGIGNSTPPAKLHVVGVAPSGTAVFTGTTWSSHFNYNGDNTEDTYIRGGKATSRVIINDANSGNVLVANGGGNVGIGTWSPTEKLEVIGNIKVSGNINAKYQDVAEWVESSQEIVAGTVVILDSSRSNNVIASTQSYDSRVAGVISRQPGLTLGEAGEGRVLVATTGRVKVKVDATSGPIEIGDLLVTSNREGFAMKSLPVEVGGVRIHRPGTLIGKALEPLAKGNGEILVLLSLQ